MANGKRRDVTAALTALLTYRNENGVQDANLDAAIQILVDIDARTGRRDPTKRKPRKGTKTGKRRGRPPKSKD